MPYFILNLWNYDGDIAMNIEEYDLDSLRKLVRKLQAENRSLRELLSEKQIPNTTAWNSGIPLMNAA